jgi:DnaJ-class molecular chaperone
MNFYDILGIKCDANKQEIKKAYRELVLKHHPDKSSDPDSINKFREIHTAYTVLYDDLKRKEYDELNSDDKFKVYDMIKNYLINISPKYTDIYGIIIKSYFNNENELRNDFNNYDFKNIYNKIIASVRDLNNFCEFNNQEFDNQEFNNQDLNIYGVVHTNIKERYLNKYKKISVNRLTSNNKPTKYVFPLTENEIIIHNAGENYLSNSNEHNNTTGDIIIRIICDEDDKFKQLNEYDIYTVETISISQYFYGGTKHILYLNDETIIVTFDSFIDKVPLVCVDNLGMVIDNLDNLDNLHKRGKLYVYFKIDGVNSDIVTDVDKEYKQSVETMLKDTFPNL